MFYPESFHVSTPTDREIQITRNFHAPRQLVFDAFTKPDLVRRWLLGPPGWAMPVCEIDLRVGSAYRYVWRKVGLSARTARPAESNLSATVPGSAVRSGRALLEGEMGMGGIFREILPPERIVATERFDETWYPGDAFDTTTFAEDGETTRVTMTILYESTEARDTARRSGMERGVAAGYDRLEQLLSSHGGKERA